MVRGFPVETCIKVFDEKVKDCHVHCMCYWEPGGTCCTCAEMNPPQQLSLLNHEDEYSEIIRECLSKIDE